MKMGSPIDLHRAVIKAVAPFPQARRRELQSGVILANAHPAPVHRLHMHRPERLNRARTRVRANPKALSLTLPTHLFLSEHSLFLAQFQQIFCMLTGVVLADEMLHPAVKRVLRQPVPTAVFRPTQLASAPRFNVQRPVRTVCLFPRTSSTHRRTSHERENPIWNDTALSESRARFGRLQLTLCARLGRQDKANFRSRLPPVARRCL